MRSKQNLFIATATIAIIDRDTAMEEISHSHAKSFFLLFCSEIFSIAQEA